MTILKKLVIAAFALALLGVAAIAIAGFFIPAERSFTNEIDINAPAERVWQVISDKEKFTEWQTQLDKVEIIDDANWIEYPKSAPEPLRFRLENDARPARMAFSYTMGSAIQGAWQGDLTPTPSGVRLRTVDSLKTDSWLMKIMMRAFFDLDGFAKDWNGKLKQRVETLNR